MGGRSDGRDPPAMGAVGVRGEGRDPQGWRWRWERPPGGGGAWGVMGELEG